MGNEMEHLYRDLYRISGGDLELLTRRTAEFVEAVKSGRWSPPAGRCLVTVKGARCPGKAPFGSLLCKRCEERAGRVPTADKE